MSAVGPTDPEQPVTALPETDDRDSSPPTGSAEPMLPKLAALLGLAEIRTERDEEFAIATLNRWRHSAQAIEAIQAETAQLNAHSAALKKEIARIEADQAEWQTNESIAGAYRDGTLIRGDDGAPSSAEHELRAIAAEFGVDALAAELAELRPLRGQHGRA